MAVKLVDRADFRGGLYAALLWVSDSKRSAHDAIDDIANALWAGHTMSLMPICRATSTRSPTLTSWRWWPNALSTDALALLKQWLKAPVIGVDDQGKRMGLAVEEKPTGLARRKVVSSPAVVEFYLHLLDRIWDRHRLKDELAHIVRYADDLSCSVSRWKNR